MQETKSNNFENRRLSLISHINIKKLILPIFSGVMNLLNALFSKRSISMVQLNVA